MSGFVGVRNREAPVTDELLAQLWQPIAHRGPDGEGRWAEGTLGVAAGVLQVTPESAGEEQPYLHRSGAVAVFDGRLDNRAELLSTLPSSDVSAGDPDVVLVAAAYATWGDRFPERLNGEYALAVLDPKLRRVLLARDVVGTRPLVFSQTGGGDVVFGSEAKALFVSPAVASTPNLDVVAEYLLGGNARATRWDTFFDHVSFVPPGVTVLIGDGGATWRTHDAFDVGRRSSHRSYGAFVEEYRERFTDAVQRRLRSDYPVGLFISGGLDSSSILSVAASLAKATDLVAVNLAYPVGSLGNEERYVLELEQAFGLEIARLPIAVDELVPAAFEQTRVLEAPTATPGWSSRCSAWELMAARGAKAYLGGGWGDQVLVDQTYLVDLFDHFRWAEVARHLAAYPTWSDVDRAHFRRSFAEDIIRWHMPAFLADPVRRSKTALAGARHDVSWYTNELRVRAASPPSRPPIGGWSRSPAHPRSLLARLRSLSARVSIPWNGMAAATRGLDDRAPFLDRDLIDYVMSVPGVVLNPAGRIRGLHRDAVRGILPEAIRDRRDKGDGTALANEAVSGALPSVITLFSEAPESGSMHLVDENEVSSAIGALQHRLTRADDFAQGRAVTDLAALEAWLRSSAKTASSEEP